MILVVGGSARNAGKTTTICEIIAATPEARWTAIKLTPHVHDLATCGDTERYAAAGAVKTLLAKDYAVEEGAGNVILESNSVLDVLTPDLFVFVDGGGDWKPSARRHAARAQYIVRDHATADLIARIREELSRCPPEAPARQ